MSNKNEELGHALNVSHSGKPTRDMNAKRILQFRTVLALILKEAVAEFKDLTPDEVEELIPASPLNSSIVDALPDTPISSQNPPISFDLRFKTDISDKIKFNIYADIEPQNIYMKRSSSDSENNKTYDLPKRAICYASKLLVSQLDFMTRIDYNALCKCYSIWICFDNLTGRCSVNTPSRMSIYGMENRHSYGMSQGEIDKEKEFLDLIETQFYRVGALEEDQPIILQFLHCLFSAPDKVKNFIPVENPDYDSIKKEAMEMCDLSILFKNEGREEGRLEGIQEGRLEGIQNMVYALKNVKMPAQTIAEQLKLLYNLSEEESRPYIEGNAFQK